MTSSITPQPVKRYQRPKAVEAELVAEASVMTLPPERYPASFSILVAEATLMPCKVFEYRFPVKCTVREACVYIEDMKGAEQVLLEMHVNGQYVQTFGLVQGKNALDAVMPVRPCDKVVLRLRAKEDGTVILNGIDIMWVCEVPRDA